MESGPPDKKQTDFIVEDYEDLTGKSGVQSSSAFEDLTVFAAETVERKSPAVSSFEGHFEDLTALTSEDGSEDLSSLSGEGKVDEGLFNEIMEVSAVKPAVESDLSLFAEPVLLGLANKELEATLSSPFSLLDRSLSLQPSAACSSTKIAVADLDYIGLISMPRDMAGLGQEMVVEVIETFGGKAEKVEVFSGQDFSAGVFCRTDNQTGRFKYLFFPQDRIKFRYQPRPIGEILVESGFVVKPVLEEALVRQKRMRNATLGQILAKQANLDQATIDTALRKAWRDKPDAPKTLAGEILVQAGLVTAKQLEDALKVQNLMRKKKIGEMLIEQKQVSEEQIYRALAVKFRKNFVHLPEAGPSEEACAALPRELALKLRVFPLGLDKGRLLLATANPEMPEIPVLLRKYLRCPFDLAVVTPSQLKSAIVKKYSN